MLRSEVRFVDEKTEIRLFFQKRYAWYLMLGWKDVIDWLFVTHFVTYFFHIKSLSGMVQLYRRHSERYPLHYVQYMNERTDCFAQIALSFLSALDSYGLTVSEHQYRF